MEVLHGQISLEAKGHYFDGGSIPVLIKKGILTETIRKGDDLLNEEVKQQQLSSLNESSATSRNAERDKKKTL